MKTQRQREEHRAYCKRWRDGRSGSSCQVGVIAPATSFQRFIREELQYCVLTGAVSYRKPASQTGAGRPRAPMGIPLGTVDKSGYRRTTLSVGGKTRAFRNHHLVWFLFHGVWPPEGMTLDHLNADRDDNRIQNLRVLTHEQNSREGVSRWWANRTNTAPL